MHTLNDDDVKKIGNELGDLRVAADGEKLENAAYRRSTVGRYKTNTKVRQKVKVCLH